MKFIFWIAALCFGQSTTQPTQKGSFHYNPKTGVCENAQKQQGYNAPNVEKLFGVSLAQAKKDTFRPKKLYRDVDAECVDFRSFNFNAILKFHYSGLSKWNLRGAQLDGAKFFFANMIDVDLRGAKLDKLRFGYTTIQSHIDRFTKYPSQSCHVKTTKGSSLQMLYCRK